MPPLIQEITVWKQQDQALTKDCESKNHVLHDFVAQRATHALRGVHSGLQVALVHPDLHLFLHNVGTERKEGKILKQQRMSQTVKPFYF